MSLRKLLIVSICIILMNSALMSTVALDATHHDEINTVNRLHLDNPLADCSGSPPCKRYNQWNGGTLGG